MKDLFQKGILVGIYFVCFILVVSIIAIVIVNITADNKEGNEENYHRLSYKIIKFFSVDLEPQNENAYYEIILPFWNITDEKVFSYVEKNITLEGNGTYEFVKYIQKGFYRSMVNDTALLIKGTGKISFFTIYVENNFSMGFFNLTLCADDHWTIYANKFYWDFTPKANYEHFNLTISDDQTTEPHSTLCRAFGYCNYSFDNSMDYFLTINNDYWRFDKW